MGYLVVGTKINRPLRRKGDKSAPAFTDCKATRPQTFKKWVRDEETAERVLLDWVETGKVTYGTYEKD